MKELFETPKIEKVFFGQNDIITTSNGIVDSNAEEFEEVEEE